MEFQYKKENDLAKRVFESQNLIFKYPDRIPVIIECSPKMMPKLQNSKFLIPKEITMGQLLYILRRRIALDPKESLYIFAHNILPNISKNVVELYQEYKDVDGFLYLAYTCENTFG